MTQASAGAVLGGRFKLVKQIGEGGMGTVWEAEHVEIGRKVAIKLLHPERVTNAEVVGRFKREAQIAGRIGHDNICEVVDVGTTEEGAQYLVMPLLRGAALCDVIAAKGQLSVKQSIDIGSQILAALSAAHAERVIHRDLKPENVFITKLGDRDDFVKVLDFGISKVLGDSPMPVSALTRTGTVMGTPYYMAPEQARGQKDQDHRVDVYATGVILYEMLTGRRPFVGESFNELLIKIVTEPFKPPRAHRPDIPLRVEGIVLRAMARDRDQRYPDAASMRAELEEARLAVSEVTGPIRLSVSPTDRFEPTDTAPTPSPTGPGTPFTWGGASQAGGPPLSSVSRVPGVHRFPVWVALAAAALAGLVLAAVLLVDWADDGVPQVPQAAMPLPVAAPVVTPPSAPAPPVTKAPTPPPVPAGAAPEIIPAAAAAPAPGKASQAPVLRAPAIIRGRRGTSVVTKNDD